jgi:hypothetical protein
LYCATFTPNEVESLKPAGDATSALVTPAGSDGPPYAATVPNAIVAAGVPPLPSTIPPATDSSVKYIEFCMVAETVRVPLDVACAIAAIGSNIARAKITSVAFFILFTLLKVLHQS